jgi:hypothetical protein
MDLQTRRSRPRVHGDPVPIRRWATVGIVALSILGLVLTGCRTDPPVASNPDGNGVAATDRAGARVPTSHSMVSLLGLVPLSENVGEHGVAMWDLEGARRAWELQPLKPSDPFSAVVAYQKSLFQAPAGLYNLDPATFFCTGCKDSPDAGAYQAGALEEHGYVFDDVDAVVRTTADTILVGRFDPSAVERALRAKNQDVATTTHRDTTIFDVDCSKNPDNVKHPTNQMCVLGNKGHIFVVLTPELVVQSGSLDAVKAVLDRRSGAIGSAADDPVVHATARALDGEHVYFARLVKTTREGCDAPDQAGTTRGCVNVALYEPGTSGAFALARDDGHAAATVVFALHNADAAAAPRNAEAVRHWYDEGQSLITNERFSDRFDKARVRIDGNVAVVAVPLKDDQGAPVFWAQYAKRDYPAW